MKEQVMKELARGVDQIQNLEIRATSGNIEIVRECICAFVNAYKWLETLELPEEVHVVGTPFEKTPAEETPSKEAPTNETPEEQEGPNDEGREV